jgi:RNA polymerase sigma factor (sigma-70 family)
LSTAAAEELESAVWMRLVEHDYRALRQYKGQASLRTFLTVVVTRLAMDVQTADWGRWRPSSRAKRLGRPGMLFETLVFRDGYSRREALTQLASAGHNASATVESLANRDRSMPRRYVPIDLVAHTLPANDDPETVLEAKERHDRQRKVARVVGRALTNLTETDRRLLRMRHYQGLKVSAMARVLNEDQKLLYRRLALLHRRLRAHVTQQGVTRADAIAS